jgi:hypothetical protein
MAWKLSGPEFAPGLVDRLADIGLGALAMAIGASTAQCGTIGSPGASRARLPFRSTPSRRPL